MKYEASLEINNELVTITFDTETNPVEWLWSRYGMSTYIERLEPLEVEVKDGNAS